MLNPYQPTEHISEYNAPEYPLFRTRFAAFLIDGLIVVPVTAIVTYACWKLINVSIPLAQSLYVLAGAIDILYRFFAHAIFGRTVGKRVLNLIVIRLNGNPLGFSGAARRALTECLADLPSRIFGFFALPGYVASAHPNIASPMEIFTKFDNELTNYAGFPEQIYGLFGVAFLIISAIFVWKHPKHRTIHDFIAGSVVTSKPA